MKRPRRMSLPEAQAVRLGVTPAAVPAELEARLLALLATVTGDLPPADSAEAAVAAGDLWALTGFLIDARHVLAGKEIAA
ncbi:hypothetical protein [Kribbella italica]|uniref:Uncharacterized protein n=1 Tax=Kribbella italica TaxID=1540520 RepID=A0A7W9MVX9_9ACTN|nr:hypothetical protein [Kribbella italica]MBB5837468.1 hypothetical protein [Kribbella italica]